MPPSRNYEAELAAEVPLCPQVSVFASEVSTIHQLLTRASTEVVEQACMCFGGDVTRRRRRQVAEAELAGGSGGYLKASAFIIGTRTTRENILRASPESAEQAQ